MVCFHENLFKGKDLILPFHAKPIESQEILLLWYAKLEYASMIERTYIIDRLTNFLKQMFYRSLGAYKLWDGIKHVELIVKVKKSCFIRLLLQGVK